MKKHILVSGGGGLGSRNNPQLILEQACMNLTEKSNPKVCFLSQASAESPSYINRFYEVFLSLGAQPTSVSLFGRVEPTWKEKILEADIVYVGGGNTKSMIALWRAWGVDQVLRQAYEQGTVMAGVSAGMICWFQQGITDSVWPLGVVEGLGFLQGSACPHFDSEVERQDFYLNGVKAGSVLPGIALEDNVTAHYVDGTLSAIITELGKKKAFEITRNGSQRLQL